MGALVGVMIGMKCWCGGWYGLVVIISTATTLGTSWVWPLVNSSTWTEEQRFRRPCSRRHRQWRRRSSLQGASAWARPG